MSGSALLTLYRSLTRHRLYAVLNIGGLALGLAVFLVLFLYVQYERGYDRQLPGWNRIWMVNTHYDFPGFPGVNLTAPLGLLEQLETSYPDLHGVRMDQKQDVGIRDGTTVTQDDIALVEPGYFKLFPFTTLQGDPVATVTQPDGVVVTEKVAHQYLGAGNPIGKTLTIAFDGSDHLYRVGAVLADPPANMTYASGIYVPLPPLPTDPNATGSSPIVFVTFPSQARATQIERQLPALIDRHPPAGFDGMPSKLIKLELVPLSAVHLIEPRDRTVVATLGTVGLLTLLIAIVNYINLATARAGLRAREVGLRKALGGTRASLIRQFLGEAIATAAIAALIALALAELALPFVNTAGGLSLTIDYTGVRSILPPLAVLILLVGGVAGLYPAFILSRFRPAAVLASARTPGGGKAGARLRQALVVLQFAIAIALSIGTAVLVAQTNYLRHADLGFRRDGLIMVPSLVDDTVDDAQRADLVRAFKAVPGVTGMALGRSAPGGGSFDISSFEGNNGHKVTVQGVRTGPEFFGEYRAHLLAGRLFDARYGGDDTAGMKDEGTRTHHSNVIINATALKTFGFASPAAAVGKPAKLSDKTQPTIVGVVGDMRFMSPREPVQPTLYTYDSRGLDGMVPTLATDPASVPAVTKRLQQVWHDIAPTAPFRSVTVDQQLYTAFYQNDAQRGRLFTIGAVLAVLIGCIGLYGLASFDTARRIKEIGIRKTLGASTRDIMRLLIGQFMRPVLIANIIAWPLAYFAMRKWLSGFDDRIALSPLYFIAATLVAITIAAATVFGQAWRVARAEPARALRYE